MKLPHIWIDADSCPALVRNHTVKIARQKNLKVTFVANKQIPCEYTEYEMIICAEEKDAADNYIFEHAEKTDLVITRDIVFADRLVSKEIACINDRGTSFTKENIKELLSERNFDLNLCEIGLLQHPHEGYDKKKFAAFANTFDRILNRML